MTLTRVLALMTLAALWLTPLPSTRAAPIARAIYDAEPHRFDNPIGIAVDEGGRVYVADSENRRIVRVDDMSGAGWTTLAESAGGGNRFSFPVGIMVR